MLVAKALCWFCRDKAHLIMVKPEMIIAKPKKTKLGQVH
jgi:hypothetical protein